MHLSQYINQISQRFQSGITTEHSFRGDLQNLLEQLLPNIRVINEPKRGSAGAPDYKLMHPKEEIALGYIEAKDIGKDINNKLYDEQFNRYKKGLDNLIITDYLTFEFYYKGDKYDEVALGAISEGKILATNQDEREKFVLLMQSFINKSVQSIDSSETLAHIMANKAKLLANEISLAVQEDIDADKHTDLTAMLSSFREFLIHDLDALSFADIYAQTIVYGMFAARYNDDSLDSFSRQEAASLIPHSNPFLRKLFGTIAGIDLDTRIAWIVDDLVVVFRYTNVKALMTNFGKATQMQDPIIHFYETFLASYDPKLRKSRGVWYTPKPVVSFIVRAVDEILRTKFGIKEGLADREKRLYEFDTTKIDKRTVSGAGREKREYHRVQILDPATGTGTFLNEVIVHIYQNFKGMEGIWNQYVADDLIPRLNGFELLMASYTMAHLKLDMLLSETGFRKKESHQRLNIYLTNSLEEHHKDTNTIFSNWLSEESREANRIKSDTPVMVILGNPPYSGESANKGEWIMSLMEDYKKEPGGKEKLKERNPKWINDDYVKFMRYGQFFIERNNEGILAFINPHGFLDNPTFRGMRWNLLKTYDEIYVIDLHGNTKKKEVSPDGSPDINVFDIQQGVSINILVKTNQKKEGELGKVFHFDLYGARNAKYDFLTQKSLHEIAFTQIQNIAPDYFFVPKDYGALADYEKGFKINDLFPVNSVGIVTSRDHFVINTDKKTLEEKLLNFYDLSISDNEVQNQYQLKENQSWKINKIRNSSKFQADQIIPISYRPFDLQYIYYAEEMIERSRKNIMKHFVHYENIGLALCKQYKSGSTYQHISISSHLIESSYVSNKTSEITSLFPLYLYPEGDIEQKRVPNFDEKILNEIIEKLGIPFVAEEDQKGDDKTASFAPIDLLDYIYAVLHSPKYREKYQEFLKIDFPRVPYPKNPENFWKLAELGGELRAYHLLEHAQINETLISYPQSGSNEITRAINKKDFEAIDETTGRIWINDEQYFDNIPIIAWEFYIGGYQPAQKWLKDRTGRTLSLDDIRHYFKIITALYNTHSVMQHIDEYFNS